MYKEKLALFETGEPEEYLIFIRDFKKTLKSTGVTKVRGFIQYPHTLLHRETPHYFYSIGSSIISSKKN